jgi:hypothetical protein
MYLSFYQNQIIVMNQVSFISGPLDLTQGEFEEHYQEQIDSAMKRGDHFVIGDARGTDQMAQQYLAHNDYRDIVVYHMFDQPRHNEGKFPTMGAHTDDEHRDCAMTQCSDTDILWVRSPEETKKILGKKYRPGRISGTEKNRLRRIQKKTDLGKSVEQKKTD